MKTGLKSFGQLLKAIFSERPLVIFLCIFIAMAGGVIPPLLTWVNGRIIDLGMQVAAGKGSFHAYVPYLVLFSLCMLLPQIFSIVLSMYIYPTSQLILRTAYKGRMLQKLKRMRYEHLENAGSYEIIEKAYGRAEEAALHLFPTYFYRLIISSISVIGLLWLFASLRYWLLLTILASFVLDIYLNARNQFNIYEEMETYWNREHQYAVLGNMLKSREYVKENQLFQSSDYLIDSYQTRLNKRNRTFEQYYFYNLRKHFAIRNFAKITQLLHTLLLLELFLKGGLEIGQFIAMTTAVFTSLRRSLEEFGSVFKWGGHHFKSFDYYRQYFSLSENAYGTIDKVPEEASIEFDHVSFAYPGTDRPILRNLSFFIKNGETAAIVGKNGEGKTTIVKLLLGLFTPDGGEIRIGGVPLEKFSQSARLRLFGAVFQDFNKYNASAYENVGVGDVENIHDKEQIREAMKKAKADGFLDELPKKGESLLGPDFDDGIDLSGGQWQRIAIARAFMGHKPILVLDEPTSQLDPNAESGLYTDFASISKGRTTILITHRLGSTMVADRIIALSDGSVIQEGTHGELMRQGGLYADMFNSQKKWYRGAGK